MGFEKQARISLFIVAFFVVVHHLLDLFSLSFSLCFVSNVCFLFSIFVGCVVWRTEASSSRELPAPNHSSSSGLAPAAAAMSSVGSGDGIAVRSPGGGSGQAAAHARYHLLSTLFLKLQRQ